MKKQYISDMDLYTADLDQGLQAGDVFENCTFTGVELAGASLAQVQFRECRFVACHLSNAALHQTALQEVVFEQCKMLGLHFEDASPILLQVRFEQCNLDFCSFFGLKLSKTIFRQCSLQEADFSQADLSAALLEHCDLQRAVFDQTNLEKADLSTARGFSIDPEHNRLKGARFSRYNVEGLLGKYGVVVEPPR